MHVTANRAPARPGAERGTVSGMRPDFRFVLGATLAIALLAVAGLGLVTSVRLMQDARISPIEDARSLAFAGHEGSNRFYDPEGARRFEGLAGPTEGPLAEAPPEAPAESAATALPATAPPVTAPAAVAPAAERVASAPATLPEPDLAQEIQIRTQLETQTPTQKLAPAPPEATGDPPRDSAPPTPRARPKPVVRRKIARAHIRRVVPASQQTSPNSPFPPAYAPWPGYENQFIVPTTTMNTGRLTGTVANRPQ
jgi:hypothetical protein